METFNPVQLALFNGKLLSVCDLMGETLRRTSVSPNIKERMDFSCAIFDKEGSLISQAAHIPVHLGSMADAMKQIVDLFDWGEGDVVILNDPFKGGTHLPDVTLIKPIHVNSRLMGFVANRAHHADIGAAAPGSMPLSRELRDEGILISPTKLLIQGELNEDALATLRPLGHGLSPDFQAQLSAAHLGSSAIQDWSKQKGVTYLEAGFHAINTYAARMMQMMMKSIPQGQYSYSDTMDNDGFDDHEIELCLELTVTAHKLIFDFSRSADQVSGNINCPPSVVCASVFFALNTLVSESVPPCSGALELIEIRTRPGSLLDPDGDAAVAAGNVETSMRVFDVVCGALGAAGVNMPAASQGTMNNVAMGNRSQGWSYYETIGGGMGAHSKGAGMSAVQCAMTNTMNTPIESLEMHYPLRVERYEIRSNSGGLGAYRGGDGMVREYRFLDHTEATLLTERRVSRPWGMSGGEPGKTGQNFLNSTLLPGKVHLECSPGDVLSIETPGGGGWGLSSDAQPPYGRET